MKLPRSFSLLTFLMLATIVAIAAALYRANNEVAQTRVDFKRYSDEMGFIAVEDESKLHIRRLGGYPLMSFAFRYYIPKDQQYMLHVGSGVADPETGLPPVILKAPLTSNKDQGTLVVNLEKLPTKYGKCWMVDTIIDSQLSRRYRKENPSEFTWLQKYLSVCKDDETIKTRSGIDVGFDDAPIGGHYDVLETAGEDFVDVYCQKEFHPSAVPTVPPEMLKQRKIFQIWLTPMEEEPTGKSLIPDEGSAAR